MDVESGWLELIVKQQEKNSSIAKVLSVESEPAVGKGENFSSEMFRLKMKIVLGSGRITTKSLILKKHPKLSPEKNTFLFEYHSYPIEIVMYSEIIPELERLMSEYGDTSDKIWCDCLSYKVYDYMVLEDLKDAGFRNADRSNLLDLNHTLFVVRNVARLHAMSAFLVHEGRLDVSKLQPYCMARNTKVMNQFMSSGMRMLIRVMKETWGKEWEEAANKLSLVCNDVGYRLEQLFLENHNQLVVLNHGDMWVNNMMFKYQLGTDIPTAFRLVDWQESYFNSFGWDLICVFQTSVQNCVREKYFDEILEAYLHSLSATFSFYGWKPDNLPTLKDVKSEIERLFFYGFVLTSVACPFFMAGSEDSLEIEDIINEEDECSMRHKRNMYIGEKYTEIIKRDVKFFMERNII